MKRVFSILLVALLLILPVLSAQADDRPTYVFVDDGLLTVDELGDLNTRAFMIRLDRDVGVYYFYYSDVQDLPSYIEQFAAEHVAEENALVLGFNADYYYFLQIGPVAKAALPDSVCEGTILEAYRAVKGDPKGKLLAYLNTTDEILKEYRNTYGYASETQSVSSDPYDLSDVPEGIARTDGGKPTLVDRAHLLTDSEAASLSKLLKEIGSEYRCDVIVATVPGLGRKTAEAYADDFFDYNGYGYGAVPDANGTTINGDGILLLLSMEARDFAISTSGSAIKAFTDYGIQCCLEPAFLPYLRSNAYGEGFNAFAYECENMLQAARDGIPYDSRHIYVDTWTDAQLLEYNDRAAAVAREHNIGIYFLKSDAIDNAETYLESFRYDRVSEPGSILLVSGPNGYSLRVFGNSAKTKFSEKKLAELQNAVIPYLESGDIDTAVRNYLSVGEKAASWRPVNWFTFFIAIVAGLLFGFIPVSGMKRQLISVNKKTSAETYMEPSSFTVTQNSDVLLGKNISRSVHVVRTESSGGGGRGGSSGGGFHGGSSTHSSSSGGTHGGHSGKF